MDNPFNFKMPEKKVKKKDEFFDYDKVLQELLLDEEKDTKQKNKSQLKDDK